MVLILPIACDGAICCGPGGFMGARECDELSENALDRVVLSVHPAMTRNEHSQVQHPTPTTQWLEILELIGRLGADQPVIIPALTAPGAEHE